jgi:glycosyltransferase involved in cell wall biosynthesis
MGRANASPRRAGAALKRLLLVTRDRHPWPLDETRARKYDALAKLVDLRVLGSGPAHADDRYRFAPPRPLVDLALLPARVTRELRAFRPDAVLVQGVHEAAGVLAARALVRSRAKVILDVQGDWRGAARHYGSPARRVVAPLADAVAPLAVRRADAVRAVSPETARLVRDLGVEPAAVFPPYVDDEIFGGEAKALPDQPRALFVGALERVKGIDVLVEAWRTLNVGTLQVVGDGSLAGLPAQLRDAEWRRRLMPDEVARALDEAWCLVLPSRSEGLPRVVIEAISRGRAVVATRVGGIADVIEDGVNGLLVPPGNAPALRAALELLLSDRTLAERLGRAAHASAARWRVTADEWARRVASLLH